MPTIEFISDGGTAEAVGGVIISDEASTTDGTTAIWPAWCKTRRYTKSDYLTTRLPGGSATDASWTVRVWKNWCKDRWEDVSSATTTPWPAWVETHRGTKTLTSNATWIVWNQARTTSTITTGSNLLARDVQISDEEYQARRVREEAARVEREARYRAEAIERERAKERALLLLREHLTDEQKAELADKRYFSLGVIDSKTGERRTYRIHQGRAGNVEQVDENGRRLKRFCIHPDISCPDEDTMLAQKLLLQTNEAEFLRVANHS